MIEIDFPSPFEGLAAHGPRWCLGSPGAAPFRLVYGVASVEAGGGWAADSRTRSDLLALPVVTVACVLSGLAEAEVNGTVTRLQPGDVFAAPVPGENALRQAGHEPNLHAYAILHHDYMTRRLAASVREGVVLPSGAAPGLVRRLGEVLRAGLAGDFGDPVVEEAALLGLGCALEAAAAPRTGASGRARLLELERRILAELPRRPTVQILAAEAGVSPAHFIRRFQEATGQSPGRFMARVVLDEASRMLRESRAPLKVVAARVGYSSDQALAHAFRRHRGRTPGVIRRGVQPDRG